MDGDPASRTDSMESYNQTPWAQQFRGDALREKKHQERVDKYNQNVKTQEETLQHKLIYDTRVMLHYMGGLTTKFSNIHVCKARCLWRNLVNLIKKTHEMEDLDDFEFKNNIYLTPEWKNFEKVRIAYFHRRSGEAKEKRQVRMKKYIKNWWDEHDRKSYDAARYKEKKLKKSLRIDLLTLLTNRIMGPCGEYIMRDGKTHEIQVEGFIWRRKAA